MKIWALLAILSASLTVAGPVQPRVCQSFASTILDLGRLTAMVLMSHYTQYANSYNSAMRPASMCVPVPRPPVAVYFLSVAAAVAWLPVLAAAALGAFELPRSDG